MSSFRRAALVIVCALALLAIVVAAPPAVAITVGPGVVFRPSNSWGNLTFSTAQSFTTIDVDATGVTLDGVRFGFQKLPAAFPGLDLTVTTWTPLQTVANATSIAFSGTSPSGSLAYFNLSGLVPLWEYDFFVDGARQAVQFSDVFGGVSFEWSIWSTHAFVIALGGRSAGPPPLKTSFTYVPSAPGVAQTVYFAAVASGGRAPYTFRWSFGDGGTAFGSVATHVFPVAGTYTVGLSVSDGSGQMVTTARTLTVTTNPPPPSLSADFAFSPPTPSAFQAVSFTAVAVFGTPPYNFSWAFGDGFGGSGNETAHAFGQPGPYNVTLNVSDSAGARVGVVHPIVIQPGQAQYVFENVTAAFTFAVQDTTVTFTDQSHSDLGLPINFRMWFFGDGGRSGDASPVHTYVSSGLWTSYRAILVVCDTSNHCGSASQELLLVNWGLVLLLILVIGAATVGVVLALRRRRRRGRKRRTAVPREPGSPARPEQGERPEAPETEGEEPPQAEGATASGDMDVQM